MVVDSVVDRVVGVVVVLLPVAVSSPVGDAVAVGFFTVVVVVGVVVVLLPVAVSSPVGDAVAVGLLAVVVVDFVISMLDDDCETFGGVELPGVDPDVVDFSATLLSSPLPVLSVPIMTVDFSG